jgi:hypothetical protein
MKCIYTYLVVLLCCGFSAFGQNAQFVFAPSASSPTIAAIQNEYDNVNFVTLQEDLAINEGDEVAIILNNDLLAMGKAKDSKLFADNYQLQLHTSTGIVKQTLAESGFNGRYFTIRGLDEMRIGSISDFDHQYTINFEQNGVMYYIEPLSKYQASADRLAYIMYASTDVKQTTDGCGVANQVQDAEHNNPPQRKKRSGQCLTLEYAWLTDWNIYNKYGGNVNSLIARTMAILNASQNDYNIIDGLPDDVKFKVVEHIIITCDTCNPWTSVGDITLALDSFSRAANSLFDRDFDAASCLFDGFASGSTIGLAYVDGICYTGPLSGRYFGSNVIDDYSTNLNSMRSLLSHELGHNFSCSHDPSGATDIMAPTNGGFSTWSAQSQTEFATAIPNYTCMDTCMPIMLCDTIGIYGITYANNSLTNTLTFNWSSSSATATRIQFYNTQTGTWSTAVDVPSPATSYNYNYAFSGCSNGYIAYLRPLCGTSIGGGKQIYMTITRNPIPALTITPSANNVFAGVPVTFTSTQAGGGGTPTYTWFVNGVTVGTGASYTSSSFNNNDVVTCTMVSADACAVPQAVTSAGVTMQIQASILGAAVYTSASATNACSNAPITYTANVQDSSGNPYPAASIVSYQWYVNGGAVGTSSNVYVNNSPVNGDQVYVVVTVSATVGTSTATFASGTFTLGSTGPTVVPTISIASSTPVSCTNNVLTFTASTTDGGVSPGYQWLVNGANVGTNSDVFSSSSLANGDLVQCVLTSSAPCASPAVAASNTATVVISALNTPAISITATQNIICVGSTVTLSVVSYAFGGTNPSFQWKVNGVNVGSNDDTLILSTLTNGAIVSCVLASNDPCVTNVNATSNALNFIVKNAFKPIVTVNVSPTGPICQGVTKTYTATATLTGTNPVYSWQVNGTTVLTSSNTFVSSTLNNGDVVTCTMLSNSALCLQTNPTLSKGDTLVVNPTVTPDATITSNITTVCDGGFINFSATVLNDGTTPTYAWYKNGVSAGASTLLWSTNIMNNGDVFTFVVTSSAPCLTKPTDTSNAITVTVLPINLVTATITASNDTICVGNNVGFNLTAVTNSGLTPAYQWQINGANVGTNATSYSSATLANGDIVVCNVTSSATCPSTNPTPSNAIVMTVFQPTTPTVTIQASDLDICIGDTVDITAITQDGGTAPTYQWFWNSLNVNDTDTSYSNHIFENTDYVYCVMQSNALCRTRPGDTSNIITMSVSDNITPEITLTQSGIYVPVNGAITYTAATTVLPPYSISWYRNGVLTTTTTVPQWNTTVITPFDSVYAIIGGFTGCYLGNSAVSKTIYMQWPTGLDGTSNAAFVVFPNPVTTNVHIGGVQAKDQLALYDVTGKLLNLVTVSTDGVYDLPMEIYSKGIYQVRISRGNYVQVVRLIKE